MDSLVLRVEGLSKLYCIGQRDTYRTLRDSLSSFVHEALYGALVSDRRMDSDGIDGVARKDEYIWALRTISFEVTQGEVLGIIGPNGAGKTTLLKILSRITEPSEGHVEIHGRVGSLLEVGTGFHPELTGRENIYLSGAILGMKRSEIERKFDEIVTFSGVERFIDTPVKRYSSGMHVRLAFSVSAHLDPDILIVDEVLSVGDAAFQERCLGKMDEVAHSGRTVLFVSHNMGAVRNLCSRGVLLDHGRIVCDGATDDVIQNYLGGEYNSEQARLVELGSRTNRSGSGRVRAVWFGARGSGDEDARPQTGGNVELSITYEAQGDKPIGNLLVGISVVDNQGNNIFLCSTGMNRCDFHDIPSKGEVVCKLRSLPLIPGEYWVNVLLKDDEGVADSVFKAGVLNVVDGGMTGIVAMPSRRWGCVVIPHEWEWRPVVRAKV